MQEAEGPLTSTLSLDYASVNLRPVVTHFSLLRLIQEMASN